MGEQELVPLVLHLPLPVAARSKARVCGHSLPGFVGSNPAGGMKVCLLCVLWVVRQRSVCRADKSSRGGLPIMVCVSVIVSESMCDCE